MIASEAFPQAGTDGPLKPVLHNYIITRALL